MGFNSSFKVLNLFIAVRMKEVIKTGCRMIVRLSACINHWRERIFVYQPLVYLDVKVLQQYILFILSNIHNEFVFISGNLTLMYFGKFLRFISNYCSVESNIQ